MLVKVCDRRIRIQGRLVRIARLEGDGYVFLDNPEPLLAGLQKCGVRIDLFTFMQRLPETEPKYPYPTEWDNLAVLPVSTFEYWWTEELDNKTRNMVRKAEKKRVVVREVPFGDELVRGIREIYNESPIRQGRRFPHFGKDLATVGREEGTFLANSIFIGAFLGDQLIGFAKLVPDETRTQAGLMNIVSMIRHRDRAPQNALIAHAVRACADRGIRYLVYSKFDYGKRRRDSLRDFKERNGFSRVDLPRYYVPLTPLGRLALRLGLHRRPIDRLPEPVVAKAREWRSAWYSRRLGRGAEVSQG